jgi:hypothetical protein
MKYEYENNPDLLFKYSYSMVAIIGHLTDGKSQTTNLLTHARLPPSNDIFNLHSAHTVDITKRFEWRKRKPFQFK